jgi:hypothetical protein
VLLLLRERGGDWTTASVARELRISDQGAEFPLRDLALRKLLATGAAPDSYRYAPETAELLQSVDALADAYRNMKYSVINVIYEVPADGAHALANAFRLRKPKGDK